MIDHFYSNKKENIVLAGVTKTSISDYYLVFGIKKFPSLKGEEHTIEFRDFKYFSEENFLQDLTSLETLDLRKYSNPNQMWYVWKEKFTEIVDNPPMLRSKLVNWKKAYTMDNKANCSQLEAKEFVNEKGLQNQNRKRFACFQISYEFL